MYVLSRIFVNQWQDAFDLYHKRQEAESSILGGPALPALGHALAGSTGAVISNVITYPLDLIITRLQIQRQLRKNSSTPGSYEYKSIRDAAEKIYAQEGGLAGFYTGIFQDTSKTIADSFLFFLAYNFLRQSRLSSRSTTSTHLPVIEELGVGFLGGALSKFFTTPIANVVTRKQTAAMLAAQYSRGSQSKPRTVSAIIDEIQAEKGLQGLWSGYSASLILTLNPSITFFLYETFKRLLLLKSQRSNPSPQATFILAALSKAIASTITYPFSLAKTRAQISSPMVDDNDEEVKNTLGKESDGKLDGTPRIRKAARTTVFSTVLNIARNEGVSALYEGLSAEVLKGFFSHGITMIVKEAVHKLIIRLYYGILKVLKRYPNPQDIVRTTKNQASGSVESLKVGIETTQQKGQSLSQQGSQRASGVYESGKTAIQSAGTSVQNSVSATAVQVSNAVGDAYNKARGAGASTIGSVTDTTSSAAQSTKSNIILAASKASEAASASCTKASDVRSKAVGGVSGGTKSAVQYAGNTAQSAKDTAKSTVTAARTQASDVARAAYSKAGGVGGKAASSADERVDLAAECVGRKAEELGRAIRPSNGDGGNGKE